MSSNSSEKGVFLTITTFVFVLIFTCSVGLKWAVDTCGVTANLSNRIFVYGRPSKNICKYLKESQLKSSSVMLKLPKNEISNPYYKYINNIKFILHLPLLHSLIPGNKYLIVVLVSGILVSSLLLAFPIKLLLYWVYIKSSELPNQRRTTAAMQLMSAFSSHKKPIKPE